MKTHCRCRKCGTRRVLKMHPEHYLRQPFCLWCGDRNYRPDKWMNERKNKACHCDGYHFPHRPGSLGCKLDKTGEYK